MLCFRNIIFSLLLLLIASFGFADQCPDMSQRSDIPSGWKLYGGKVGTSNIFYKAQWYQGVMRGILCWYKPDTNSMYAYILESEDINLQPEFSMWTAPFGKVCDNKSIYCDCSSASAEACLFHRP